MSIKVQPAVRLPPTGLHSPPDSNAQKNITSDSELSDVEAESEPIREDGVRIEPSCMSDGVPVFTPTMEQFKDFEKFITAVNPWGMTHGIAKVIPPKEWLDEQPPLHDEVKKIRIKNPYIQEMNSQGSRGSTGNFRQLNLSSNRTYNIVEWRSLCNQLSRQPPARRGETRRAPEKSTNLSRKKADPNRLTDESEAQSSARKGKTVTVKKNKQKEEEVSVNSRRNKYKEDNYVIDDEVFKDFDYNLYDEFDDERCRDLEVAYWKHISYAPPIYGGDMPGTLFTNKTKVWDLRNLPGFLNYLDEKVPGINTTYLYLGSWKSTFSWHLEDVDLYSINYLHFGAPKQWYSISQGDRERFEKAMASKWPDEFRDCDQFLRHKTFQISPAALWKEFKIKVNKIVHRPGEFMITFPYGYHAGYNLGYNCAEAVNFAVDEWIPIAEKAKRCECAQQQDSVWVDLNSIRKSLPPTHKWYLGPPVEEEYFDDFEDGNHPTEMLTPPHSGSEVKTFAPRKRKPNTAKDESLSAKRRIVLRVSEEPPCILCPNSEYELLETENGKQAHRICGEYIPETSVTHGVVRDVNFISKARMGLKCIYCRSKRGACFQCSAAKCTRAYHATCAASAGVLVQKVWVTSYGQDGTEYKEEVYDFRCRFHRPRRDKRIDENALSDDVRIQQYGAKLVAGDICQAQFLFSEIFAGLVLSNNYSEGTLILRVLFDHTDIHHEIDYKWLLVPPEKSTLPKPSANAVPMPNSYKAKESLNTRARQVNDLPRSHDPFCDNYIWAEFNTFSIEPNLHQAKVDFNKEDQIWHYLGQTSTEARAQFTEDPKKPRDNPKGNFLNSFPKPASAISRQSCCAPLSSSRSNKGGLSRRSSSSLPINMSNSLKNEKSKTFASKSLQALKNPSASQRNPLSRYSQSSQDAKKRKRLPPVYPFGTNSQHLKVNQASDNRRPLAFTKIPKVHGRCENQPGLSSTKSQKVTSNLLLTQPSWPPISSRPQSKRESDPKPLTKINCSTLPEKVSSSQTQKRSEKNKLRQISDPKLGSSRAKLISSLFTKYKYLQIEHNKDTRTYKSPYRVGSGFMNGYEGTLDNLKKHCEIMGLKNIPLPTLSPQSRSPQLSNAFHPAIKKRYQCYQPVKSNAPNQTRGEPRNSEETFVKSESHLESSNQICVGSKKEALDIKERQNFETPISENLSVNTFSSSHLTLLDPTNDIKQTNNLSDKRIIPKNPITDGLSYQKIDSSAYPGQKPQTQPKLVDELIFPDVPPDTVTLVERMMSNLRKAVDLRSAAS